MKKFILACVGFGVIFGLIMFHSLSMAKMGKELTVLTDKTQKYAMADDWTNTLECMKQIKKYWDKRSIWTALTIKTDELSQIEISFEQSRKYAKLHDKEKFMGEFTMFSKLVEHIPHQEGFHIEEIL